jgi:hypothetical protein
MQETSSIILEEKIKVNKLKGDAVLNIPPGVVLTFHVAILDVVIIQNKLDLA